MVVERSKPTAEASKRSEVAEDVRDAAKGTAEDADAAEKTVEGAAERANRASKGRGSKGQQQSL